MIPVGCRLLVVEQRRAWRHPAELSLFDFATGQACWSVSAAWVEAVVAFNDVVCAEVGRNSGETDVRCWSTNGEKRWRRPKAMLRCATNDQVLVETEGWNARLELLAARDGRRLAKARVFGLADVFASEGAFVFAFEDVLVARSVSSLDELWTVPAVRPRVTATRDCVIVVDQPDVQVARVRVLDAASGEERCRATLEGWRYVDDVAYVAGHVLVLEGPLRRIAAFAEDYAE